MEDRFIVMAVLALVLSPDYLASCGENQKATRVL